MNAITTGKVRRIRALAAELDAIGKTALEKAVEAGRLLCECKAGLAHGEWLPWLKSNFTFSERTAQDWMRLAREIDAGNIKSATVADLGLREAYALASPQKRMTEKEVAEKLYDVITERIEALERPPGFEVKIPGRASYKLPGDMASLKRIQRKLSNGGRFTASPIKTPTVGTSSASGGSIDTDIYLGLHDPKIRAANIKKHGAERVRECEAQFMNGASYSDFGLPDPLMVSTSKELREKFQHLTVQEQRDFLTWAADIYNNNPAVRLRVA